MFLPVPTRVCLNDELLSVVNSASLSAFSVEEEKGVQDKLRPTRGRGIWSAMHGTCRREIVAHSVLYGMPPVIFLIDHPSHHPIIQHRQYPFENK